MKLLNLIIPSKNEFDNTVHSILKRPDYKHLDNALRDFIQKAKDTIKDWLLKLLKKTFNNLSNPGQISDTLSTIFMIIGIVVIITIIIIIIIKINKTFEKKRKVTEILGEKIDDKTTPQSLRKKASDFIKSGDLRQALRFDFIALLLLMHEKNLVYLDEAKTNEEIYRFLKKNSFSRLALFRNLIDIFNYSWYGHKDTSEEVYKNWSDSFNLLWNEVIKHEG